MKTNKLKLYDSKTDMALSSSRIHKTFPWLGSIIVSNYVINYNYDVIVIELLHSLVIVILECKKL